MVGGGPLNTGPAPQKEILYCFSKNACIFLEGRDLIPQPLFNKSLVLPTHQRIRLVNSAQQVLHKLVFLQCAQAMEEQGVHTEFEF